MKARPLALVCAALMLGSLFLPWMSGPFGGMVPWDAIKELQADRIGDMLGDLPPEGMAFVASFVLAAVMVLLGLMGSAPRILALLTGGIPVGLVGWGIFQAMQSGGTSGLPVSGDDIAQVLQELSQLIGIGAWAWLGGGFVLLVMGLFFPSRT